LRAEFTCGLVVLFQPPQFLELTTCFMLQAWCEEPAMSHNEYHAVTLRDTKKA